MSSASDPEPTDPAPPTSRPPFGKPPRSALGPRDLIVALLVLVPLILLVGGLSRCSFSPGGPSVDPSAVPVVDAPAGLRALAPQVPFGVRIPEVPAGWRANSVDQALIDGGRIVRTGFLTPQGRFVRLVQSDAPEEALVAAVAGEVPVARGTVEAGGQRWVVYGEDGAEPLWVAEAPVPGAEPVRLLVTGSGSEADFAALAAGALAGELLPVGTAPN